MSDLDKISATFERFLTRRRLQDPPLRVLRG
jgi:hypothetical protein